MRCELMRACEGVKMVQANDKEIVWSCSNDNSLVRKVMKKDEPDPAVRLARPALVQQQIKSIMPYGSKDKIRVMTQHSIAHFSGHISRMT